MDHPDARLVGHICEAMKQQLGEEALRRALERRVAEQAPTAEAEWINVRGQRRRRDERRKK
jgi:hypothetical protein